MTKTPILITADYWMNSQLSVARFFGGVKFNGEEYVIVPPKNDLLLADWVPVYNKLGRERTIGLIKNGTSLEVAKQMIKAKENVEKLKLENGKDRKDSADSGAGVVAEEALQAHEE